MITVNCQCSEGKPLDAMRGKIRNFSLGIKGGFLEEVALKLGPRGCLEVHLAACFKQRVRGAEQQAFRAQGVAPAKTLKQRSVASA